MSQNFELLNQLQEEIGTTPTSRAIPRPSEIPGSPNPVLLRLAQSVFLSEGVRTPHVIVLCGIEDENGSSHICLELGRVLAASSNRQVCLVDGDARRLRLTKAFAGNSVGGTQKNCTLQGPNLWVAAPDTLVPGSDGVLAPANQLKPSIARLQQAFQFVLIDAPGINAQGDAAVLGQLADATILVVEANRTRKVTALKAKHSLETMNIHLLGIVLNNRTYPIPESLYRKL